MSSTLLWLLSVSCLKLTSVCLYTGFLLWVDTLGSRSENYQKMEFKEHKNISPSAPSTINILASHTSFVFVLRQQ